MQPFWAELSHSERFSEAQLVVLTSDTDSGIGKLDSKGGAEKLFGRQKENLTFFSPHAVYCNYQSLQGLKPVSFCINLDLIACKGL